MSFLWATASASQPSPPSPAAGEHWDVTEQMDTYYNCIPHFNFRMAMDHSPDLKGVTVAPREGGDGGGLGFGGGGNGNGGLGSGFSALQ